MPDPFISVIVIAHDKKDYLLDAVKSASEQTLPRESFEILCVKNFKDDVFDSELSEYTDVIITSESQNYGSKATLAIEKSRGEIFCFLDYDDKFSRDKLEKILEFFKQDNRLVYMHNGRSSNLEEFHFNSQPKVHTRAKSNVLDLSQATYSDIVAFFRNYPDFNSSSISVRKSILEDKKDSLEMLIMHPDTFLLFCALETEGVLMDTPLVLTFYRLHESTTNSFSNSYTEYFRSNLEYYVRTETDWKVLNAFITKDPVKRLCGCEILHNKFVENIFDSGVKRNQFFSAGLDFLKCIRTRKLFNLLSLVLQGFVIFLLPKIGRKLFFAFRNKLHL